MESNYFVFQFFFFFFLGGGGGGGSLRKFLLLLHPFFLLFVHFQRNLTKKTFIGKSLFHVSFLTFLKQLTLVYPSERDLERGGPFGKQQDEHQDDVGV